MTSDLSSDYGWEGKKKGEDNNWDKIFMYTYICDFCVSFGTYHSVRARLATTLSRLTQEGRPEPVVEV